ncbi:MAG TPA: AAA family ATPase [Gemmataceae bacterium]|nr:AAA family ATPase [Gemmataceae bacterium]
MYETRFGLRQRPFPVTPDSACYYPATGHERALARLRQALDDQQGLALLTGETGLGKTLVAQRLQECFGTETVAAFLTNSHFECRAALLQAILYDLSLPFDGGTEQELRLRLTEFLLQNTKAGRRFVLIVDEAQHLTADLLEELRLLGNLEAGATKALQVVLIGQTSLLETLRKPELASLLQRLEVRANLEPLGVEEAADYVLHHLRLAGARPEAIVSDEALEVLARHTRGVPRLLNQAARQALMLANDAEASFVDVEAALEALNALGIEIADEEEAAAAISMVAAAVTQESDEESEGACRLYDAPRQVL